MWKGSIKDFFFLVRCKKSAVFKEEEVEKKRFIEQNYGTKYIESIGREILLEYWKTLGIFEIRREDC